MWRSAVQLCAGLQMAKPLKEHKNCQLSIVNCQLKRGKKFGGLAQLARATALQAVGQRFDSVILHE